MRCRPPKHRTQTQDLLVSQLRSEVGNQGWILFSAKTELGDYDLFVCRPDGSRKRNLTQTPEWSEYGGRYSPDGSRMLYRRLPKGPAIKPGEGIHHDLWGAMGTLVIARADGSNAEVQGSTGDFVEMHLLNSHTAAVNASAGMRFGMVRVDRGNL